MKMPNLMMSHFCLIMWFSSMLVSAVYFKEAHFPVETPEDMRDCLHLYPLTRAPTYICAQLLSDPLVLAERFLAEYPGIDESPNSLAKFLLGHYQKDNIQPGKGEPYVVHQFAIGHTIVAVPIREEDDPDYIAEAVKDELMLSNAQKTTLAQQIWDYMVEEELTIFSKHSIYRKTKLKHLNSLSHTSLSLSLSLSLSFLSYCSLSECTGRMDELILQQNVDKGKAFNDIP